MSNRTADPKTILFTSNYGTGAAPPSTGCVVSNYTQMSGTVADWPQAAKDSADAAGLEAPYKPLLTKVPATPPYDYLKSEPASLQERVIRMTERYAHRPGAERRAHAMWAMRNLLRERSNRARPGSPLEEDYAPRILTLGNMRRSRSRSCTSLE